MIMNYSTIFTFLVGLSFGSNLECPAGTEQIGEINADIGGCGLESCHSRYQDNYATIDDCSAECESRADCKSFTWNPLNGDKWSPGKTVCTLYDGDIPTGTWGPEQILCKPSCKTYDNCGTFRFNGGCQEHFSALIFQDKTGTLSFDDCCSTCKSMTNCGSFLYGKPDIVRQNWCNIYDVVCTDNGDTDWYMFTPDLNSGSDWSNYDVNFEYNGGCQQHFDSGAFIFQDNSGLWTFKQCYDKCISFGNQCGSFTFGKQGVTRQNWCNIYSIECTDNGDTDWDVFTPITISNAEDICLL